MNRYLRIIYDLKNRPRGCEKCGFWCFFRVPDEILDIFYLWQKFFGNVKNFFWPLKVGRPPKKFLHEGFHEGIWDFMKEFLKGVGRLSTLRKKFLHFVILFLPKVKFVQNFVRNPKKSSKNGLGLSLGSNFQIYRHFLRILESCDRLEKKTEGRLVKLSNVR